MPVSCPANIRETKIAFGFKAQADLVTMNAPTELWSLTKTNPTLSVVNPVTENDANDIGKGDEFATQVFPSHIDTAWPIQKYASSEFLAWLFCFTTGNATSTAAGTGHHYCATPSDPVVACLNLPPFTVAEQIRPQPDSVVDRALVGVVVNDWTLSMESGPGRNNCRVEANCVGTGKFSAPSTVTPWPTVVPEHFLNAASAQVTIAGINYVLAQSLISLTFRWNNNVRLDTGFFPGSGTQNGFAIRGRMEYGTRECALTFTARAAKGSPEFLALVSQTPGAASISLKGALIDTTFYHDMTITIPKCVFSAVINGEADGIVTVECTALLLKDPAQPYVTLCATTAQPGILGLLAAAADEGGGTGSGTGGAVTLQISQANAPAAGGSGSFSVLSTATWSATSTDSWITVSQPTGPVTGNGSVQYLVAQNTTGAARTGHITVGTSTFQINQPGA